MPATLFVDPIVTKGTNVFGTIAAAVSAASNDVTNVERMIREPRPLIIPSPGMQAVFDPIGNLCY